MTTMTEDEIESAEVAGYPKISERGPEGDWQRARFTIHEVHGDLYDVELDFAHAWADAIGYEFDGDGQTELIQFAKNGEMHLFDIEHGWEDSDVTLRDMLHEAIAQRDHQYEIAKSARTASAACVMAGARRGK